MIEEGEVMNGILYRRMVKRNQNFLAAVVGKTGSGKSYACLRLAELWYRYRFKKPFPIENVCWDIPGLLKALQRENLKRGELFILEEAGTSAGNLDFQNKLVKSFNYILQSFRNMNVALLVNLPYFNMLAKGTRTLIHMTLETCQIDKTKKLVSVKPLFQQPTQKTNKIYQHYPRRFTGKIYKSVKRFSYGLPSEELRSVYEEAKAEFVQGLIVKVHATHADKRLELGGVTLTSQTQQKIVKCWSEGITDTKEIVKKIDSSERQVQATTKVLAKKGLYAMKIAPPNNSASLEAPIPL